MYLDTWIWISSRPNQKEDRIVYFTEVIVFYVNFNHTNHKHFENYPFGLLNVVGYWAEAEIFGGVLLFEREEEGSGVC